jgi:hypothetical protein
MAQLEELSTRHLELIGVAISMIVFSTAFHDMENSSEIQDVAIDGMERLVYDTRRGMYPFLR